MRKYVGILLGAFLALNGGVSGQDKTIGTTRYDIAADLKTYPQGSAKETLASLLKAVESKRVDYVVAQLADPSFVDDRVKRLYGGHFAEQVDDTRARLDPLTIKQLQRFLQDGDWQIVQSGMCAVWTGQVQRFLKDGDWQEDKEIVFVRLKDTECRLYFKKSGGRWFLENANQSD